MSSIYMKHKLEMYTNNNYMQKYINTGVYYPYIAFNYNIHTFDINEDVLINYYCTDYWQSEITSELTDIQFILEYNLNGIENRQIVNIGDNILNLGKLSKGDYWYTLRLYDLQGNSSHSIYGEFRVIDKVAYDADMASKTATITSDILICELSTSRVISHFLGTTLIALLLQFILDIFIGKFEYLL